MKTHLTWRLGFWIGLWWLWPLAAAALQPVTQVEGIAEYRLPNGLQVLLAPDDSKPTTTVNLTYRVGSRHESYGETGMAHLLEHLIFKGTPRHPTVWAEFNKRGLRANGSTWLDRTNYFASFAANESSLAWTLDWLADSMTHSFIARKDLDSEMTVVRNEWERGENSPESVLFEKTLSLAYQWHNYGKTTIGARADVENVDIARLQAFYRLYYQPDNAALIVSGSFDAARTLALIEQHFGAIARPPRELPRLYTLEPVQDGERQLTLRRSGGTPALLAVYHTVPGAHGDQAALELLSGIMADAPSGRLHRRLVDTRLAASVWSWAPALHDPGFVSFGATLAPGQSDKPAAEALLATVESLGENPITNEELQRARLKWLTQWEAQFADPERLGVALSESVAQGDWRLHFLLRDRVRAVTLGDVQRVAQERLLASNRTYGVHLPTAQPQRAPSPASIDLAAQMKTFVPKAGEAAVAGFDATPAAIDARTTRRRLAGAASGVQVAWLPKPTRGQLVHAAIVVRGANLRVMHGQAETAAMMAAMLDKGTRGASRQQIADRLDALQAQLSFDHAASEPGALRIGIQTRRAHLPEVISLVGQLLREPVFDTQVLEEVKQQALAAIEANRKEPEAILEEALFRHGSPYARGDIRYVRTADERVADVRAVTVDKLTALHRQVVGGSRVEVSAVGDFDEGAAQEAVERVFSNWETRVPYERVRHETISPEPVRMIFRTPDKRNAVLMVVQPLPLNESDADYPALMMANYLLGQDGNSRLWVRVRETEGLSYDVGSSIAWDLHDRNSWWVANATFAPGNRAKVEAALAEEIRRAQSAGFTAQELAAAKAGLLSQRRLARAQDGALTWGWVRNLDANRSFARAAQVDARLQGLTLEEVNSSLKRHIDPARFVWGVAGDFPP